APLGPRRAPAHRRVAHDQVRRLRRTGSRLGRRAHGVLPRSGPAVGIRPLRSRYLALQMSLQLADVERAAQRLGGVAHRTPVLTSRTLDERTGARVGLKAENFQRGGAFKFRGAYNKISSLDEDALRRGVLACSSGNHAQAVAIAAALLCAHVERVQS